MDYNNINVFLAVDTSAEHTSELLLFYDFQLVA